MVCNTKNGYSLILDHGRDVYTTVKFTPHSKPLLFVFSYIEICTKTQTENIRRNKLLHVGKQNADLVKLL